MDADPGAPQLLYCWVAECFNVLVPKKRGSGFLKVPYGHHHDQGLTAIANSAQCDVFGLDGSLEFQCSGAIFHGPESMRDQFSATVVPQLERHYGMTSREVSVSEFWALHPVRLSGDV
jgi:hypothetical protein